MTWTADQHSSSASTQADRRAHPRFAVQVQIELREEGSQVPIRTETSDLSRGGCYVQLNMTLTLGAYIHGKFWLDGSAVVFRGRVVTCHPQFGNGIMFLEFEGSGDEILAGYLNRL